MKECRNGAHRSRWSFYVYTLSTQRGVHPCWVAGAGEAVVLLQLHGARRGRAEAEEVRAGDTRAVTGNRHVCVDDRFVLEPLFVL